MKLDETDMELVRLLQEDCKKTTKQYADALHLSKTAVYERIRRLERNGVITQAPHMKAFGHFLKL